MRCTARSVARLAERFVQAPDFNAVEPLVANLQVRAEGFGCVQVLDGVTERLAAVANRRRKNYGLKSIRHDHPLMQDGRARTLRHDPNDPIARTTARRGRDEPLSIRDTLD